MLSWKSFFVGISYGLSFGWPRKERYKTIPERALTEDWRRISKDLQAGLSQYKAEKK